MAGQAGKTVGPSCLVQIAPRFGCERALRELDLG
jgi:hypothetical protein